MCASAASFAPAAERSHDLRHDGKIPLERRPPNDQFASGRPIPLPENGRSSLSCESEKDAETRVGV
jgi:hypothetical protein